MTCFLLSILCVSFGDLHYYFFPSDFQILLWAESHMNWKTAQHSLKQMAALIEEKAKTILLIAGAKINCFCVELIGWHCR